MTKLNVYRRETGKPMIYSKESAESFLLQTKHPLRIHIAKNRTIVIQELYVRVVETIPAGLLAVDFVESELKGEQAIKWAYNNRKIINARFKL